MTWRAKFLTAEDEQLLRGPSGRERLDLREDEGVEALLKRASELGLRIDWRRLNRLNLFLGRRHGSEHYVPPALVEVCRGLARHRNRQFGLAVDPHARTGLLLSALVSEGIVRAGVGYNAQDNPLVGAITRGLPIALEKTPAPDSGSLVDCWSFDDEIDDTELDLVVCCPPWGASPAGIQGDRPRYRKVQHQLLFESHRLLIERDAIAERWIEGNGFVVFLMPARFSWSHEASKLLADAAEEAEFRVAAVMHLAAGLMPGIASSACIVVATSGSECRFSHTERGQVFAAELDDNPKRTALVVENLFAGQAGDTLALGALHDAAHFRGFPSLLAEQDLASLRMQGGDFVPLREIGHDIRRADRKSATAQTLFIRRMESTRELMASTDPGVIDEQAPRWSMLELDPMRAEPEYLAHWLNTDAGRVARRAVGFRASLVQIHERDLGNLLVHLPPLDEQRARLRVVARARELECIGQSVRDRACLPSVPIESLEERLRFDHDADAMSLEDWAETLPFPLASILRKYKRDRHDPQKAASVLLHFFEAFGEFWATILLSALEQAGEIPGPTTAWIRDGLPAGHSLERGSMGTWSYVGGRAAKWLRERVLIEIEESSNDRSSEPDLDPLRFLATRSTQTLESILSKGVQPILQRATYLRNRSSGHGGASSDASASDLLDVLCSELSQLRAIIAPAFESLKMYRLGDAKIGRGVKSYAAEELQGSNSTFLKTRVELEDEPPTGSLVLCASEGRSLTLLPLIRMAAPKGTDNACYFYNRTENGTARFVSYHQGDHAEDLDPAPLEFLGRWHQNEGT